MSKDKKTPEPLPTAAAKEPKVPAAAAKEPKVPAAAAKEPKGETVEYTYIGGGENSPSVIKFMRKIDFMIGEPTEIPVNNENARVLEKIQNNPCFVEGRVDRKVIIEREQEAKKDAEEQRKKDFQTNKLAKKKMSGE